MNISVGWMWVSHEWARNMMWGFHSRSFLLCSLLCVGSYWTMKLLHHLGSKIFEGWLYKRRKQDALKRMLPLPFQHGATPKKRLQWDPKKFHLIAIRLQESHIKVKNVECTLTLWCRELSCENITVVSSLDHGRVQCHSLWRNQILPSYTFDSEFLN